ncbi:hypothetical protein KUTeg_015064 [Tegillarca granosa]|uniref:Uncharacterized protein n=1 Tax=Tegillarca granosa TaxID=220873 RepID=A0ABQ9EP88_TEGGR|nr:hypothetical protein KUTeg_015064 [Tegillarca granosa]
MGAGIIAGIPFHASGGSLNGALTSMSLPSYSVPNLINEAESMASSGAVDATSNMQNDRVYIFAGTRDTIVNPRKCLL